MNILLLGANGQVGLELQRALMPLARLKVCDRNAVDLENFDQLSAMVRDYRPEIVVNAAAYTAVDQAEAEPEKARLVNADAAGLLATEVKRLSGWLIHYSTDYVFDGTKATAYVETDSPNPQSVYGATKLDGERAIGESGCKHLIFRTSWVYSAHGSNFVKTILRLARERDELKVVSDQVGAPTNAELVADITALCLYRVLHDESFGEKSVGTYHLTPSGETSWYKFARLIVSEALRAGMKLRINPDQIDPVATSEYSQAAKRPANSRLDTRKLSNTFGLYLPGWEAPVRRLFSGSVLSEAFPGETS